MPGSSLHPHQRGVGQVVPRGQWGGRSLLRRVSETSAGAWWGSSWVRYSFSSAVYQWRTSLAFSIPTSLCSGYELVDSARVNPLTPLLAGGVAPSEAA